jgi:hypothetical protein
MAAALLLVRSPSCGSPKKRKYISTSSGMPRKNSTSAKMGASMVRGTCERRTPKTNPSATAIAMADMETTKVVPSPRQSDGSAPR